MKNEKELKWQHIERSVIGELITLEKYTLIDHKVIAHVVQDTILLIKKEEATE